MFVYKLNNQRFESSKSKITGQELLTIANLSPTEDYELLYKINEKGFTPIQLDEEVDLKSPGIEGFRAKPYKGLFIKVDEKQFEVQDCFMTPNEIMRAAGINTDHSYLNEIRHNDIEVTYQDDVEHKVAITRKSCFVSYAVDPVECVIVNARDKVWNKNEIYFEDIVKLQYGTISNDPNVIYTVTYKRGVPSKPEGSMVRGEVIYVKNKMIFNVTQTNRS